MSIKIPGLKSLEKLTSDIKNLFTKTELVTQTLSAQEDKLEQINSTINNIPEEIERIENIAKYKEHRFIKPQNKVYKLVAGTKTLSLDEPFNPDTMDLRVNGKVLTPKTLTDDTYDFDFNNNIITFKNIIENECLLWIKSFVVMDLELKINKEYIYEPYIDSFGNTSKRIKNEIWTGDIPKSIEYLYNSEKPYQVDKMKVSRLNGIYERTFHYEDDKIKATSDAGVDDFFVYKMYGGQGLDRLEVELIDIEEIIITHNFKTKTPFVQFWAESKLSLCDVTSLDTNTVKIKSFGSPLSGTVIIRR